MLHFTEETLETLECVNVNVPWKIIHKYLDIILSVRMNVEIGFEADDLDGTSRSEFQTVADQLQSSGCKITLHGPFWDLCPGSSDPLIRHASLLRLHQFLDLVTIFKPLQVVCHTGFDPRHHRGHFKRFVEKSLGVWEPLAERARVVNVPLLLENVWEFSPDFHYELLRQIRSPFFGFCLDVGHQNTFSNTPLRYWLERLVDFLMEIHLHDNDGTSDSHLPVGYGNVDFESLLQFLKMRNKNPVLTVEPHREEHLAATLAGLRKALLSITSSSRSARAGLMEGCPVWPS